MQRLEKQRQADEDQARVDIDEERPAVQAAIDRAAQRDRDQGRGQAEKVVEQDLAAQQPAGPVSGKASRLAGRK